MRPAYIFWRLSNLYGWLFGFAALAPLHRTLLNLSVHGLGYDNARHTGEEWFINTILAKEKPAVCIDIGANVGAYTNLLLRSLDTKVYAIEPAAASFNALESATLPHKEQVHLIRAAMSDHNGSATLYAREALSEKASLTDDGSATIREEVRTIRLDTLVHELGISNIDFIKIDTEGHELAVFKGMQETLSTYKPAYIQFEFNHIHLYNQVTLYGLAQLLPGYRLYRLLSHGWLEIDPSKFANNIFMFCNIVAKKI